MYNRPFSNTLTYTRCFHIQAPFDSFAEPYGRAEADAICFVK
jgi:hypothetical protein